MNLINYSLIAVNEVISRPTRNMVIGHECVRFSRAKRRIFLFSTDMIFTRHDREFGLELGLATGPVAWKRAFQFHDASLLAVHLPLNRVCMYARQYAWFIVNIITHISMRTDHMAD